jgi:hypothetical protein
VNISEWRYTYNLLQDNVNDKIEISQNGNCFKQKSFISSPLNHFFLLIFQQQRKEHYENEIINFIFCSIDDWRNRVLQEKRLYR